LIRLIVSDVDGTLLSKGVKAPSPRLLEQISGLKRKGILFCVASGRSYSSLRTIFDGVADDMAFIADDGALILRREKILFSSPIKVDRVSDLLRQARESGCGCVLSHLYNEGLYGFSPAEQLPIRETFAGQVRTMEDFDERPVYKVGFYRPDSAFRQAVKSGHDGLRVSYEDQTWLELSPVSSDKGSALTFLLHQLGISKAQTLAFGDNYNDISMLQNAGVSYRMKESRCDLSDITKNTTESVEETLNSLFFRL